MASISKPMTRKDGSRYFKISVSRGYGISPYTMRWNWPDSWSLSKAEREVKKAAAKFELDCENGLVESRADRKKREEGETQEAKKILTFQQYAENIFIPSKNLSENTVSSYNQFLRVHIYPSIGRLKLPDISHTMLRKLLIDFQNDEYSHQSCIKLYNILNGVFKMAALDDSIVSNPMLKVQRPKQIKDKNTDNEDSSKAYTIEEMRHIFKCLSKESLKWQVFVLLLTDTGIRRGEAVGLRWQDIDFQQKTITVRNNVQYTVKGGVYETTPKNGKARIVDIGDDLAELLKKLREEQTRICISKYVFNQDGSPNVMHPQTPTRYFHRFGERYGIKDFHPHKLRHTSASIAITQGADIVSVSERLGHSDTAVTLRMYAHGNPESIRKAGQIVRDALRA